jgi:hypothetical protein
MKCKLCGKEFHWCHNCGYDRQLHPLAYGYCSEKCLRLDDGPIWEDTDDDYMEEDYPI